MRLHNKISIGGSFIFGRGFLVQIAPVAQLAAIGIVKQNRLDVSGIGAPGASLNVHYRPTEKISFGFNFKTPRKYNFQGDLETVQPVVTSTGLQIIPLKLTVKVPFKLPTILESGIKIQPTKRYFIDFDYRYYIYSKALDTVRILEKQSGAEVFTQNINAKNVHLFLAGGAYNLTETSKVLYGAGYSTNGFPDSSFNPGLYNANAFSFSGGFAKRVSGVWLNLGATAITGFERTVSSATQNPFPGSYKSGGLIFSFGIRR